MPKKNDFKLDVVSVRLVKDAPIYSEHTFNNPADIAAVMGDCMCQFDREVVCVVNLRSDLKPINVHFANGLIVFMLCGVFDSTTTSSITSSVFTITSPTYKTQNL